MRNGKQWRAHIDTANEGITRVVVLVTDGLGVGAMPDVGDPLSGTDSSVDTKLPPRSDT